MSKTIYYAFKKEKDGPKIYDSWQECRMAATRYSRVEFKKFRSLAAAEAWLSPALMGTASESTLPLPTKKFLKKPIVLSAEQSKILEKVKDGGNVFVTGPAGTGKTVLLDEIIKLLRSTRREVAVTASTGIASINLRGDGTTLHSWAGIGLGNETAERLSGKIRGTYYLRERWQGVESLIIDEISMTSDVLFDKLEEIARTVRNDQRPFGGIQLIITGDFCQLPPIPDRCDEIRGVPSRFAFEAESWSRCIDTTMTLNHVFRQKDQAFADVLNDMRWGKMSKESISKLRQLSRKLVYEDGIEPTELYPRRWEVEKANNTRLEQIAEIPVKFNAVDRPGFDERGNPVPHDKMAQLLGRIVAPPTVILKTGAQVMLIKNLVQGHLVNGSTGKVIGFFTGLEAARRGVDLACRETPEDESLNTVKQCPTRWPLVKFTNDVELLCVPEKFTVDDALGNVEASRTQVPLILAWALSMHKSQGQTLQRVKVDLRNIFEKGQAYVALSRATSLDSLEVHNFDPLKVMAHPRVIEWYEELNKGPREEPTDSDEYDQYLTDEAYGYPSSKWPESLSV